MALIKHFSFIQLILLLSIERFLSLSLCANYYFRYAKPGLHGVYLISPCLCCVVLSHMGALFDFTFHNIRLSTQSFLLLTPQFLPRQSQQLSQILKSGSLVSAGLNFFTWKFDLEDATSVLKASGHDEGFRVAPDSLPELEALSRGGFLCQNLHCYLSIVLRHCTQGETSRG